MKELDPAINESEYHFSNGSNTHNPNNGIYYSATTYAPESAYRFQAFPNNSFHYVYYSVANGRLLGITFNNQDLSGDDPLFVLYDKIKFVEDDDLNMPVFYSVADNMNLGVNVPDTAADQLTITNYVQDATTGIVTFDFTVKINSYRSFFGGLNTTRHDITITGKFNSGGKVYSSVVGRIGG